MSNNGNLDDSNKSVDYLLELEQKIQQSLEGAKLYLHTNFRFSKDEDQSVGGWCQFVDEKNKAPTATGTAHGIIALINCGENPESEIILRTKKFLIQDCGEDGSWSKPSLKDYCGLT